MTPKKKKVRLDLFLSERQLSISTENAKKDILAGWVKVNGETVRDPSRKISGEEVISVARPGGRFVSRGGDKLLHALKIFNINLNRLITLDLGASTGGFTDCMLQSGALKVYAVDVGFNQLDYSLRTDPRVKVFEKTHVKDLTIDMFSERIDFFTADLSFISILKALPAIYNTFQYIRGIILVKPQFEAEPSQLSKGIVTGIDDHKEILKRVAGGISAAGFRIEGVTYSPLKGASGNIEFLFLVSKNGTDSACKEGNDITNSAIIEVVETAHYLL